MPLTPLRNRFASPNRRSFTIRFSSSAVLFQRHEDGLWCLAFRLANIRKSPLIHPQARARGRVKLALARVPALVLGSRFGLVPRAVDRVTRVRLYT